MAETGIYARQEFGKSIARAGKPALLLVDFVNGFLDPDIFGGGNIAAAAERSRLLLDTARSNGAPVVFTRIVYAEDGSNRGVWCEKAPRLGELTDAVAASQVVAALAPRPGEYVVCKTQASAFFGTDLAPHLFGLGVQTLVVAGCTTSGCVRASVVDAISYNFRPLVVADCVGDRSLSAHEANLFDMAQKYADVTDADAAIRRLAES